MAEPSILGALRDPQFRSDTLRNLVEALNGAKRSLTVGSLGAVGDMGSTLANLVRAGAGTAYHETTGRPIPQALEYRDPARDFGTSAHLGGIAERQGWLPPQTFSMPEQAGALLGPIAAMKAPDLAQSTLRGLVSALKSEPSRRMVEGYMGGMGMKPQAIVYHGSPHQFDAFDSSKIGTGEGAQAYGHGLYLAESPAVAENYRSGAMGWKANQIRDQAGQEINLKDLPWGPRRIALENLRSYAGDYAKAEQFLRKSGHPTEIDALMQLRQEGVQVMPQDPSLYKVDLPDPLIARMLDWDKPPSKQSDAAYNAIRDAYQKRLVDVSPEAPIGQHVLQLQQRLGSGRDAGNFWRQHGIPGLRYLDGGSRADGAGTSNFVVFPGEESALTILERNGKPVRR